MKEIKAIIQDKVAANNSGIRIEYLGIKKIGLPEAVTQAVFDRMTADRQKLAQDLESKGLAEAQKIKSSADREAQQKISVAQAEALRIQGEGDRG